MMTDNGAGSEQNVLNMLMQRQQNSVGNMPQFAGLNSESADSGVMDSLYAKLRE